MHAERRARQPTASLRGIHDAHGGGTGVVDDDIVTRPLSRQDMRIFAEIVDASALTVDAIVARAMAMRAAGADVIDLGCLPDTAFPHLEDAVRELKAAGLAVSVDSAAAEELRRAAKAGAAFLLSLTEHTLDIARDSDATPVLIPANHGDLESLLRAAWAGEPPVPAGEPDVAGP